MRYAAYIRVSTDEQVRNYSIDAQTHAIEAWIKAQNGLLAKIYVDKGESGRTCDRPAFQKMRRDARKQKFDALVVHKFDRFARNRKDALTMKTLLRRDYGIKVFSVTEPSEDSDGLFGTLFEGIMETVADWYSQNLAAEVAKGKRERARQGLHNNGAPFGLKKNSAKVLVLDEKELPGLLLAYRLYATGKYSDRDVARLLNEAGYRSKSGRPFSKDTVRHILQNRIYLGEVKYQRYERRPDGSRSSKPTVHWFKGQHEPVIDAELFERCQQVRRERAAHRQATEKYNPYLLRNLAYCWRCCVSPPENKTFQEFGKMRCQAQARGRYRYYRCRATELGYRCKQKGVRVSVIDPQVVAVLKCLKPPSDWRRNATQMMGDLLGVDSLEERVAELRAMIRRMDVRWDNGFVTDEREYFRRRMQLECDLERLMPIPEGELQKAVGMLGDFPHRWNTLEQKPEEQHKLLQKIVRRVYIEDDQVVAMALGRSYGAVLGDDWIVRVNDTVTPLDKDAVLRLKSLI